jgi:hypothetical protein
MPESPDGPQQYAVAAEILMLGGGDLDLPDSGHHSALINDDTRVVRHCRVNDHRQTQLHGCGSDELNMLAV